MPTTNSCSEAPATSYQVMTVVPLRIHAWPCPFLWAYLLEIVMVFSYLCYADETLLYLSFLKEDVSVSGIFALQTASAWMKHHQYQCFKDQASCYPSKSLDITQYHCQNLLYRVTLQDPTVHSVPILVACKWHHQCVLPSLKLPWTSQPIPLSRFHHNTHL